MAGYSEKALWMKLGYQEGMTVLTLHAPASYRAMLGEGLPKIRLHTSASPPYAAVHVFATSRDVLEQALTTLRNDIAQDGMVWVSWPKKSAGVSTNVTEQSIRAAALPLGFVDIKVCAVDDTWSGLKLVIRKAERR
jgi:hypothetical protein